MEDTTYVSLLRSLVRGQEWLESYSCFSRMTTRAKSWEHHIRVVSNAICNARNGGVSIQPINLVAFVLGRETQQVLSPLLESLRELLGSVRALRLTASHSALHILSLCILGLHQFDMCSMMAPQAALKKFLASNKSSICSIGFHRFP